MLFGFPHKSRFAFLHDERSLRIGAVLESAAADLAVRRRKGRKDTLRDAADATLPESSLQALIGAGDRGFFERMFSLDEAALKAGGRAIVENKDDASAVIFAASAGLADFKAAFTRLAEEADAQWGLRRSGKRAYFTSLDLFEEAARRLRDRSIRAADLKERRTVLEEAHRKLEELTATSADKSAIRRRLARVQTIATDLALLATLKAELDAVGPVPSFSIEARSSLHAAEQAMAQAHGAIEQMNRQLAETVAEQQAIAVNEAILARSDEIQALAALAAKTEAHEADLPKRSGEVELILRRCLEKARRIGLQGLDQSNLRTKLPTELAVSRLTELGDLRVKLEANLEAATKRSAARKLDAARIAVELATIEATGVPPRLMAAIDEARALGAVAIQRAAHLERVRRAEAATEEASMALLPWRGTREALAALEPPLPAETEDAKRKLATAVDQLRLLDERLASELQEIREIEGRERAIRSDGKAVSPAEIEQARGARDTVWRGLRNRLLGASDEPDERSASTATHVAKLDTALTDADRLADRRFEGVADSTQLLELARSLRQIQERKTETARLHTAAETGLFALREAWRLRLAGRDLPVLKPEELHAWSRSRQDALKAAREATRERQGLDSFDRSVQETTARLHAALTDAGHVLQADLPIGILLALAQSSIEAITNATGKRAVLMTEKTTLDQDSARLDLEVAAIEEKLHAHRQEWTAITQQIGLVVAASVDVARDAARLVGEIRADLNEVDQVQRRVDSMRRDLELLATRTESFSAAATPDLAGSDPRNMIMELQRRAAKEKQRADSLTVVTARIADLQAKTEEAGGREAAARAAIEPLMKLAETTDLATLRGAIDRSERAAGLKATLEQTRARILAAGDGLDVPSLIEESNAVVLDSIPFQIREIDELLSRLQAERDLAIAAQTDARRSLAEIAGGDDAAQAEADRQSALADMAEAVQRYVEVRLPARLLRWAIDRYRKEKQTPLLRRAGELFATLTGGSFCGLDVDLDGDTPVLLALRSENRSVSIDALSHGTEDQLYLALRLAAIEAHLDRHASLPFVADDLFVQFDDVRSAAGFRALASLANKTQVLFFTHHDHLVEIAKRSIDPALNVLRL